MDYGTRSNLMYKPSDDYNSYTDYTENYIIY